MLIKFGNPLYPFPLPFLESADQNQSLCRLLSNSAREAENWASANSISGLPHTLVISAHILINIFSPSAYSLNIPALIMIILSFAGFLKIPGTSHRIFFIANILLGWMTFFSPSFEGMRFVWDVHLSRILLFPCALSIVLAASISQSRFFSFFLHAAGFFNMIFCFPLENDRMILFTAILLFIIFILIIRRLKSLIFPVILSVFLISAPFIHSLREAMRSDYLIQSYDVHPISKKHLPAWLFFNQDEKPFRIAVACGFYYHGHDCLIYPLLGKRFQNEILYIPITRDGSIIDYETVDENRQNIDFYSWLKRLKEKEVDYLVLSSPFTPEKQWIIENPEKFNMIFSDENLIIAAFIKNDV
jgi:hypothetical protein